MITSLKAQIHRRFYDKSDVESNVLYAEATILDPRFKNRGFRDVNKYERAVSGLKKKVGLSSRINVRTENSESRSTAQPRPEAVGEPSNSSASIWQKFDEEVSALVPCNPVAAGIVELDKYIQEPLLDGGERYIAITQSLIYMIIKDNLPLSCVEKEGLKQFVHTACPRYKLPSRFKGHTGEYIKDCFENVTSEFSIDKSKIVNFSTDNGSNMVAAVNLFLGTKKGIPCVAHTINLIIDGVLKNNTHFSNLADQIKCIVTYFKHSVSASDQLRSEQLTEGKKEGQILMLIQAVSTRWNSCLDMMERFMKLSSIVAKVLASRTKNKVPDMVATSQLTILHDLVTLLGPFKIVTEDLSAEKYVTASLVIPLTNLLKQEIEQTKISTAIGLSVQNDLLKGIEDRLVPLQENLLLTKATILDPRFKKLHFMSAMAAANAITDLSKEIIAEHKIRGNRSPTVGVSPRVEKETTSSLWDRHEDMQKYVQC
ncbi:Zinc finger BED domain-containing protein 1 [Eumeta japonica]|uniref:Zinc finger BED domain-containing protein 1 n=1 Tax=Eumeta variegata TaxID=151549 RepID=A0A4C1VTH1_EUMVA|nr:Zinc finger BED domain-containing protein 1 [Eumeta japonica]